MARYSLIVMLFVFGVLPTTPSRAIEPALRINLVTSNADLTIGPPNNQFALTIAVFSNAAITETIVLRQILSPARFLVVGTDADNGTVRILKDAHGVARSVQWDGTAYADHPVTVYIRLIVRPAPIPGIFTLVAAAQNDRGNQADSSAMVRICCEPTPKAWLPIILS